MGSPVSRRTPDECNAIKSRGFGHRELTSVANFETGFGTSRKPVYGLLPHCRLLAQKLQLPTRIGHGENPLVILAGTACRTEAARASWPLNNVLDEIVKAPHPYVLQARRCRPEACVPRPGTCGREASLQPGDRRRHA